MSATDFRYEYRVTYADCTLGNHVYYARYLQILEAARGEFFRQVAEPLLTWQERGVTFPVVSCRLQFLAAARYDEVISVAMWLRELRGARLTFGFELAVAPGRRVLEGETYHACATLAERPQRLPKELVERLRPYLRLDPPRSEAA